MTVDGAVDITKKLETLLVYHAETKCYVHSFSDGTVPPEEIKPKKPTFVDKMKNVFVK